ncbi:MAG: hypothetical protein CL910_00350 [Deltaproteobacteria bacterium]|nr:hypothetical protein [Deltaproteobacteria bacterium]
MTDADRIELARRLFEEGWSGGKPESPLPFLTEDAVMRDILGHPEAMHGHEAIVAFFGPVAQALKVMPEEYFVNERGIALTWMAYIEILDESRGPENKGRFLCGEGMSRLEYRDGKVSLEVDYWKGPQGICDDWKAHLEARRAMSPEERGAVTGA